MIITISVWWSSLTLQVFPPTQNNYNYYYFFNRTKAGKDKSTVCFSSLNYDVFHPWYFLKGRVRDFFGWGQSYWCLKQNITKTRRANSSLPLPLPPMSSDNTGPIMNSTKPLRPPCSKASEPSSCRGWLEKNVCYGLGVRLRADGKDLNMSIFVQG